MKSPPLHINKTKQKNPLFQLLLFFNLSVFLVVSSFFCSLTLFAAALSLHLSVFSLFLSPTLLLTSSAVLRPLHEANTHSGLAASACMRSTEGPIKRRQEQETDTRNVHPQGPRRYHHCPVPHVSTEALCTPLSSPFHLLISVVSSQLLELLPHSWKVTDLPPRLPVRSLLDFLKKLFCFVFQNTISSHMHVRLNGKLSLGVSGCISVAL